MITLQPENRDAFLSMNHVRGTSLFFVGELLQARRYLERGVAAYRPEQHAMTGDYGQRTPACPAGCGWGLTEVCRHFGEGVDTPDLREARALLEELGAQG